MTAPNEPVVGTAAALASAFTAAAAAAHPATAGAPPRGLSSSPRRNSASTVSIKSHSSHGSSTSSNSGGMGTTRALKVVVERPLAPPVFEVIMPTRQKVFGEVDKGLLQKAVNSTLDINQSGTYIKSSSGLGTDVLIDMVSVISPSYEPEPCCDPLLLLLLPPLCTDNNHVGSVHY